MSAFCGMHSSAAAVATCDRCGRFCCEECLNVETARQLCAECFMRLPVESRERTSGLSITAFVICFVTPLPIIFLWGMGRELHWVLSLGFVALPVVLAAWELKQARARKRTEATFKLARLALILGLIGGAIQMLIVSALEFGVFR